MDLQRKWRRQGERLFLGLAILLALGSVSVGVRNALERSQDFQWSGERVLLAHGDPWAESLAGDPAHHFIATQIPNYLPILYVLLVPVGLLPLLYAKAAWAVCNVLFAVGSACLAGRTYGLSWRGVAWLICLMLMATPTRNTIGNGQQGLLVLAIWCLTLLGPSLSHGGAVGCGLAYFKFSFAPPMVFLLFFRWGWRALVLSSIAGICCLGGVWVWITGGQHPELLLRLVGEPIAVARHGFSVGLQDPNLMNLLEPLLHGRTDAQVNGVELGTAAALCLGVSYFICRRREPGSVQWQMALMATMSYALFKHHAYDAVVLLLPLTLCMSRWRERAAQVGLVLLAYLFYGQRMLEATRLHPAWMRFPEFAMLIVLFALVYRLEALKLPARKPALGIHAVVRTPQRAAA